MKSCFIFLLSWMGLQVSAQLSIGAKSGLSLTSLHGSSEKNKANSWREAFYGGVFLRVKLNGRFYLQPELNYSPQGAERNGLQEVPVRYVDNIELRPATTLFASFNKSTILNYLELPLLAKMVVGREVTYSVYAGPYISFLLSAKTKLRGSSRLYLDKNGETVFVRDGEPIPVVSFDRDISIKKDIKKMGTGMLGGFSVGYPLWTGRLLLDVRGILGLTNIQAISLDDGKVKTGSLVMTVGYEFDLDK